MTYALAMNPQTGILTFLKRAEVIRGGQFDGCLWDEREGTFVLEDVIGKYDTITALKADYDRAIRECDAMGDTRGLEHPYPMHSLAFILVVKSSPLYQFPMTKSVFLMADDQTRAFMRRRPVFFGQLLRRFNRGQPITPHKMAELAHDIVEAIIRKWGPEVKVRCEVGWE